MANCGIRHSSKTGDLVIGRGAFVHGLPPTSNASWQRKKWDKDQSLPTSATQERPGTMWGLMGATSCQKYLFQEVSTTMLEFSRISGTSFVRPAVLDSSKQTLKLDMTGISSQSLETSLNPKAKAKDRRLHKYYTTLGLHTM